MALSPLRGAIRAARGIFASDENEKGALAGIPSFTDAMSNAGMAPDLAQMPARAKMPAEPPNWLDYIGLAGATLQEMGGITGAVNDFTGRRKSMQQEGEMNQLLSELNLSDEELGLVSAGMGANVLADRVSDKRENRLYDRGRADTVADRQADRAFQTSEREASQSFEERLREQGWSRDDARWIAEQDYKKGRDQRQDYVDDRTLGLEAQKIALQGQQSGQMDPAQLASIYNKGSDYIAGREQGLNNLGTIANEAKAFYNLAYPQGGAAYTGDMGLLGWMSRGTDPRTKELEGISGRIAALMRQPGSGGNSDKDMELFMLGSMSPYKGEQENKRFMETAGLLQEREKAYTDFLNENLDISNPQSLQAAKAAWNEYVNENPLFDEKGGPLVPALNKQGVMAPRVKSFDEWYEQKYMTQPSPQQQGPEVFYRIENGRLVRN